MSLPIPMPSILFSIVFVLCAIGPKVNAANLVDVAPSVPMKKANNGDGDQSAGLIQLFWQMGEKFGKLETKLEEVKEENGKLMKVDEELEELKEEFWKMEEEIAEMKEEMDGLKKANEELKEANEELKKANAKLFGNVLEAFDDVGEDLDKFGPKIGFKREYANKGVEDLRKNLDLDDDGN